MKSPALRGRVFCYFRDRLRRFELDGQRDTSEPLFLPSLEDACGIQMAISQILAALGSGGLENRKAGLYLYGLQLATQLLAQLPEPALLAVARVSLPMTCQVADCIAARNCCLFASRKANRLIKVTNDLSVLARPVMKVPSRARADFLWSLPFKLSRLKISA